DFGAPIVADATIHAAWTALPVGSVTSLTVGEVDGSAALEISLSAPALAGGASFDVTTTAGTATAGVDYETVALTSVTVPAGATSVQVPIPVTDDALVEPAE